MANIFELTDDIRQITHGTGGIYQIEHISNGRIYIGSSCNIKKRLSQHFSSLRKNKHHNPLLQNDFIEFGEKAFIVSILEIIDDSTKLQERERYYKSQTTLKLYNLLEHNKVIYLDRSLYPSFFNNICIKDDFDCWKWLGSTYQDGYGSFCKYRAHRIMYSIFNNQDPGDLLVRHKCDNKSCVNPNHLWLGSDQDNHRDRALRGIGNFIASPEIAKFVRILFSKGLNTKQIIFVVEDFYNKKLKKRTIDDIISNKHWYDPEWFYVDRKKKLSWEIVNRIRLEWCEYTNGETVNLVSKYYNIDIKLGTVSAIRNNKIWRI